MIKDNHQLQGFNTPKFPKLKGHIKLTLHNVHNGKNEVYEGDNIVTNAVQDIFANNYAGCIDYTKLWGANGIWKTWFGGVLCYESQHPNLNANDYFPQSDTANHLTAHAGQTAIDPNHDDDDTRGNPLTESYVETENSKKIVWEWGTTKGNGVISALSLTHSDTGNAGLGSTSYYFQNNFSPLAPIQSSILTNVSTSCYDQNNTYAMYDENHGIGFHIGEDEYAYHNCLYETTTLTVYVNRFPFKKVGLFETLSIRQAEKRVFVIEDLPFTLYCQPAWYFDYENKYLWIFSNITGVRTEGNWGMRWNDSWSKTTVNYAVIDCENETLVTSGTIVSDQQDLAPTSMEKYRTGFTNEDYKRYGSIAKDGDYVYLPTSTNTSWGTYADNMALNQTGFKKIKVSSSAHQSKITFNSNKTYYTSPIVGGDILIQNGRVVNGDTGYTCPTQFTENNVMIWAVQNINRISSMIMPISSTGASYARYIVANKMVNTTKYNLPSSIQKTASQAMSVEYTLQEVEPTE